VIRGGHLRREDVEDVEAPVPRRSWTGERRGDFVFQSTVSVSIQISGSCTTRGVRTARSSGVSWNR
jgi:hypothetical protein